MHALKLITLWWLCAETLHTAQKVGCGGRHALGQLTSMVEVGSALLVAACYLPPTGLRQLELHTEWPVAPHPYLHTVLAPDDHPSAPAPSGSQQLVAEKSAFGPARR